MCSAGTRRYSLDQSWVEQLSGRQMASVTARCAAATAAVTAAAAVVAIVDTAASSAIVAELFLDVQFPKERNIVGRYRLFYETIPMFDTRLIQSLVTSGLT